MKPNEQEKSFQQRREELLKSRLVTDNGSQSSQYLESLIEDVVLNGVSFDNQLPIFMGFAENEGLDANQLKNDIVILIDILKSVSGQPSRSEKMGIVFQAQRCHISEEVILRILSELQEKKKKELEAEVAEREARKDAERKEDKTPNGVSAIDLGLPSGTKWASCNVGATKPWEYGGYYAWGETEENGVYDRSNYIHCDGDWSAPLCHNLGNSISGTPYDVAYIKWGGNWKMPTLKQIKELIDNCERVWISLHCVEGYKFTGSNGNSIFLPAAGRYVGPNLKSSSGYIGRNFGDENGGYWSGDMKMNTQDPEFEYTGAYCLDFYKSGKVSWGVYSRGFGFSVRPVITE